MRTYNKLTVVLLAGLASLFADAEFTYYPETGILTDGIWTLKGTLVEGSTQNLAVSGAEGSFDGDDDKTYSIDLTEIYDSDRKRYFAVSYKAFSAHKGVYNPAKDEGSNLYPYRGNLREFIAPDCKSISESGCFVDCVNLEKVQLSEQFSSFDKHRPFQNCSKLKTFSPRELNISKIPIQCFSGCSSLTGEFVFPKCSGHNGGGQWFQGCSNIESVKMPCMKVIESSAFASCSNLKYVEFSEDLEKISTGAFNGCSSLPGDVIRTLLHPGIKRLGSNETDVKNIFMNCSSFDGALEWNFKDLTSTNVVGQNYFSGCTRLSQIVFKTYVYEIRGSSLLNLAPGAEIYMHSEPVKVFEGNSVGNSKGPFIKLYIDDQSMDDWMEVIDKTYHVFYKKDFNNELWTESVFDKNNIYTRDRNVMITRMKEDDQICALDSGSNKIRLNQNGVVAFCMRETTGSKTSELPCFWVMKTPKKGFKVIVR